MKHLPLISHLKTLYARVLSWIKKLPEKSYRFLKKRQSRSPHSRRSRNNTHRKLHSKPWRPGIGNWKLKIGNYFKQLDLRSIKNFFLSLPTKIRKDPKKAGLIGAGVIVILLSSIALYRVATRQVPPLRRTLAGEHQFTTGNDVFAASIGDRTTDTPTVIFEAESNKVAFTLKEAKIDQVVKQGNKIVYKEVLPNTDLSYETLENGVKEELILHQRSTTDTYIFTLDTFETSPAKVLNHFHAPVFYDKDGNYLFHFEKPFAYDSRGERTDNVTLQVEKHPETNQYLARLTVSSTWLNDPERAYPVYIDPTIVHDESSEFAGEFNRSTDTGSGTSPSLESYYQESVVDDYTVGFWRMNNDWTDESGYGNNGSASGNAGFTTSAMIGSHAGTFDGTGDYVTISDSGSTSFDLSSAATISFWAKYDNTQSGTTRNILAKDATTGTGRNYDITINTSDTMVFDYWQDGTTRSAAFLDISDYMDSQWHHYTMTIDTDRDGRTHAYIDGELQDVASAAITGIQTSNEDLLIGARVESSPANYFNGQIDELHISSIARSPEEIKAAAQRRPSATYTSSVIDLTSNVISLDSLSWSESGVATGDGETLSSSTNLVAQYNFNETSGTTADNAEGTASLDGTLTGFSDTTGQDAVASSGWTANNRRWGSGALMFDGVNDYVDLGYSSSLYPSAYTIEAWVKSTNMNANDNIFAKGYSTNNQGVLLNIDSTNKVKFGYYDGTWHQASSTTTVGGTGEWHFITAIFDGSNYKLYIDGVLEDSISGSKITDNGCNFYIGSRTTDCTGTPSATDYFGGVIDSVRIYSRAITEAEILSNYQAGQVELQTRTSADNSTWEEWKPVATQETQIESFDDTYLYPTSETNLTSYWPIDETADNSCSGGQDVCDVTGTNHGTDSVDTDIVTGTYGNARSFNGSTDYISLKNSALVSGDSSYAISLWFKADSSSTSQSNMYSEANTGNDAPLLMLRVNAGSDGVLDFVHRGDSYGLAQITVSDQDYSDDRWHHMVGVRTSSNAFELFVDGQSKGTSTTNPGTSTMNNVTLGNVVRTSASSYFKGQIDEVRVYSDALTAATIQEMYLKGSSNPDKLHPQTDTVIKTEGAASQKITTGTSPIDPSTVAYYNFEETNGDLAGNDIFDSTDNSYDGEIYGSNLATGVVNGISGKARSFNGSDDSVQISSVMGLGNTNVTVETWVHLDSLSESGAFIKIGDGSSGYAIGVGSSNHDNNGNDLILLYETVRWIDTNVTIGTGWHHVAMVIDGSGVPSAYLDGELVGSYSGTNAVAPATQTNIGGTGTRTVDAAIDEMRISNRARTADEIAESYRLGQDHYLNHSFTSTDLSTKNFLPFSIAADRPGSYLNAILGETPYTNNQMDNNLIGLWHLDEAAGTGSYLKDSSGNGNHADPTGASPAPGKVGLGRVFNSTSDYIDAGDIAEVDSATTLSGCAWVKHDTTDADQEVFAKANSTSDGFLFFRDEIGSQSSRTDIYTIFVADSTDTDNARVEGATNSGAATNTWNHVCFTFQAGQSDGLRLFINGQEDPNSPADTTNISAIDAGTNTFQIGVGPGPGAYFDGVIDEVKLSRSRRIPHEIRQEYELGRRTHPVTIDFTASLNSGNLIADSSDTSFTVDATTYGLSSAGSQLFTGDKIIVKENVSGTEYIAQADVTAVTESTGAVTIDSWDTGSTFPSGGFTANATAFKWQREYFDLSQIEDMYRNGSKLLTLRLTDGNEGRSLWLDDLSSASSYLSDPTGSTITSTAQRYFQYRTVFTSTDTAVSPSLTDITLDYTTNTPPNTPTYDSTSAHDNLKSTGQTPEISFSTTDPDSDDLVYQVQWATDSDFSGATSYTSDANPGFSNTSTPADTSPFTSGDTVSFTFPTLTDSTTYFYRVAATDPSGSNSYGSWSATRSVTIDTSLNNDAWHQTHADQFSTNTLTGTATVNNSTNAVEAGLEDYGYSQDITITNSGSEQTNYEALLTVDTASLISAGKLQSDCDDLRFYDQSSTALNYFLESGCNTSTTQVWVEIPTLTGSGDTVISMYYGNSSASAGTQSYTQTVMMPFTGSCPSGWTRVTGYDNRFPKGSTSYGTTGGSSHTHSADGTTGGPNQSSTAHEPPTGSYYGSSPGHTHPYTGSADSQSPTPPYINTVFCSYTGLPNTITTAALGMFESLPSGWSNLTAANNRFPMGASSYGTTGGSSTHTHTVSGNTSNTSDGGQPVNDSWNQVTIALDNHNHGSFSGTSGTGSSLPAYLNMIGATPNATAIFPSGIVLMSQSSTLPPMGWTRYSNLDNLYPRLASTYGGTGNGSHTHTYSITSGNPSAYTDSKTGSGGNSMAYHTHTISGTTGSGTNNPPYVSTIFFQKNTDSTTKSFGSETMHGEGTVTSTAITGANIRSSGWDKLEFNHTLNGGTIVYQVLYDNAGTPTLVPDGDLTGNSTGFTTSPVSLISVDKTTYPTLYVRATLTYGTGSPSLNDWTVTLNDPPNAPTLDSPTNGTTGVSYTPQLKLTATDPDEDYLRYKIDLDTVNTFNSGSEQTFDQTLSQTGWSGQDTETSTAFLSGSQATYTLQTPLAELTTYYWRGYAADPDGTNTWSTSSSIYSFTTALTPPNSCVVAESATDSSLTVSWTDASSVEDNYEVQRSVNGGAFSSLTSSLASGTESYTDNSISASTTYAYRVRATATGGNSTWCTTSTLTIGSGPSGDETLNFEGLNLEGINID